MMYEYSERFVNPLSHDEVVHMKGSLLRKMPGDEWQRLANLRALIGYSITRPGKSVFFMGTELGPWSEWNHDASLEWFLRDDPRRAGLERFVAAAGALYGAQSSFWRHDHDPSGFSWIDVADKGQSVLSYARFDGAAHAIVVLNLTPVPRDLYRLGTPASGRYHVALNSDAVEFGGSGYAMATDVDTEAEPYHGFPQSMTVTLPPLSILVLLPDPMPTNARDAERGAESVAVMPADLLEPAPMAVEPITPRKQTRRKPVPVSSPVSAPSGSGDATSSVERSKARKAKKARAAREAKAEKDAKQARDALASKEAKAAKRAEKKAKRDKPRRDQ
jgi:1,4-alpha-glucan branching enzyme